MGSIIAKSRLAMLKELIFFVVGMALVGITGCSIKTPEIHGVVLDEETKQPVPEAWISATIGIKSKTVAGDVGQVISLDPSHTRTDKGGRFVIPRKKIKRPPFPVSFGTEVDDIGIGARTVDDKGGGIEFKGEKLKEFLKKNKSELTIFVKPIERSETEYFSHLQSLYRYCRTGRFGVEVPAVEGGCDEWELDYVIEKHERFIKRLGDPSNSEEKAKYSNTLNQLAYLFEKKGDLQEAVIIYRKLMHFEGTGGWFYESSERRLRELEKEIQVK